MGNAFINSFAVILPATVIPIMIAAFAAYAFTFMEFPFRDTLFVSSSALLVVPNQVALVPLLRLYTDIGLTGTSSPPSTWPTSASACRWPSTSSATTCRRCPRR